MDKTTAIGMLVNLFDDNKLTFRDMLLLKKVFDEAIEVCNEERSEKIADYDMGRKPCPNLADRDLEDSFYYTVEADINNRLQKKGFTINSEGLTALAEIVIEKNGYSQEDFFVDE